MTASTVSPNINTYTCAGTCQYDNIIATGIEDLQFNYFIADPGATGLSGMVSDPGYYGSEEKDLSIRLVDKGYRVVFYKGVYVWHDKTSVARNLNKQHRSGVCNDLVFLFRSLFLFSCFCSNLLYGIRFFRRVGAYFHASVFHGRVYCCACFGS